MMRKSTFFWLGMAVFSAAALFHTSQQVTDGREKLAVIEHDIRKEEETLRVLQAEWSYLNQPDRLEKLVREYLQLEPMKGRQFTHMENLEAAPPPEKTTEKTAAADNAPRAEEGPGLTGDPEAAQSAAAEPAAGDEAPDVVTAGEKMPAPKATAKPAVSKPAVTKPAAAKPAATKTPPAKPAAPKAAAPAKAPEKSAAPPRPAENRNFSDMMKSLGVAQ